MSEEAGSSEVPPETLIKSTDDSWLAIGILIITGIVTVFLLLRWKNSGRGSKGTLESVKSTFTPPPDREKYLEAKKVLNVNDPVQNDELKKLLMKRALHTIPILLSLQNEGSSIERLYKKGMLTDDMHFKVKELKAFLDQEMQDINLEADDLLEGWSQMIWSQAMQHHRLIQQQTDNKQEGSKDAKEHHEEEKKKNPKKKNKKASNSSQNQGDGGNNNVIANAQVNDEEFKEREAERLAQELIEEEEKEKHKQSLKKKGGKGGSGKKS